MKLFRGKRKRKILFLVLFLACVGFGFWSIFMDSSDSINVITQLQQQNINKKTESHVGAGSTKNSDPKVSVKKKKEGLDEFAEIAKEVIKDAKEKINTTNDSEEEEGSIFDWWWTLVGAYFLFKLFLGD